MLSFGNIKRNMNKFTILAVFFGLAFAVSVQAADVSISLRYQDTIVLDQVSLELPASGTVAIKDSEGNERFVNAQSVLGILVALDSINASFELSKMQYFTAFNSLYLQCITGTLLEGERCDNWLYAVNGVDPLVGMDTSILTGGEQIYVYFGPAHQVLLSTTMISQGSSLQVTAQKYQYQDNTWGIYTGVTIGFTQPDPDNPFSPIEVLLESVNDLGQVSLSLDIPTGDYNVGIKEDFYFPSVQLTVVVPTVVLISPTRQSGGGLPQPTHQNLDKEKAIQFLIENQNEDGSFGSGTLLSDWAAVAFGAYGKEGFAKEKLENYLLQNISPGNLLTDYERRAMALMSLSISPYTGTKTNYIEKISNGFDGAQFGDPSLVNDDIFALLVLLRAGYESSEDIITKTVAFILSRQQENGSFQSVDMTAAAVQVLALVPSQKGVGNALLSAKEYLQGQQENSGGFKNIYSTSWVAQAIGALGVQENDWVKNGNTLGDYFYAQQAEDGGVEGSDINMDNRIWATAYVIPGAMQKSWGDILQNFKRPDALKIVAQGDQELEQNELNNLQAQIEIVENKIAKIQVQILAARQLDYIEQGILSIAKEVQKLQPQIASLHAAYLAQLEQAQDKVLAEQLDLEDGTFTLKSGITILGQENGNQFIAEVASSLSPQSFFRSSTGQAMLALGTGVVLFLVLGGGKAILSLLRRPKAII